MGVGRIRVSAGAAMGALIVAVALAPGGGAAAASSPARIAFSSGGRIFTIAADGAGRHRVAGPARPLSEYEGNLLPDLSPDGARVAFTHLSTGGPVVLGARIYVVSLSGGGQHALTHGRHALDYGPQWSPDSDSLTFARIVETRSRLATKILVSDSAGTHVHTVAKKRLDPDSGSLAYVYEPTWDPDGTHLAYTLVALRNDGFIRSSLYRVAVDGGGRKLLRRDASAATYSPSGSQISFSGTKHPGSHACNAEDCVLPSDIYVMRADGTHLKRLTRNRGEDTDPDWSGDGQRIVFQSDRNQPEAYYESAELYSIRPDGTCMTWLTNGTPPSESPDWQEDPSAATDPGACGATNRRPRVETDVRPARQSDLAAYWLGKRFRSHLLTDVRARAHSRQIGLGYDDCGFYSAQLCEPPLRLSERSGCEVGGRLAALAVHRRIRERHGALVALGGGGVTALTGSSVVDIRLEASHPGAKLAGELQALRGLRRLGQARPRATLPRTRLRVALLRQLRKAEAVQRRSGGLAAVAKALKVSRAEARAVLRLARAVDRYGHVDKLRCAARRPPPSFASPSVPRRSRAAKSALPAVPSIPTPAAALARFARHELSAR